MPVLWLQSSHHQCDIHQWLSCRSRTLLCLILRELWSFSEIKRYLWAAGWKRGLNEERSSCCLSAWCLCLLAPEQHYKAPVWAICYCKQSQLLYPTCCITCTSPSVVKKDNKLKDGRCLFPSYPTYILMSGSFLFLSTCCPSCSTYVTFTAEFAICCQVDL